MYTLPLSLTLCRSAPQGQYYPLLACPCLTGVQCTCMPNKMPVRKFFRQKWFEVGGRRGVFCNSQLQGFSSQRLFPSFVYMKFLWKILHGITGIVKSLNSARCSYSLSFLSTFTLPHPFVHLSNVPLVPTFLIF